MRSDDMKNRVLPRKFIVRGVEAERNIRNAAEGNVQLA
jgi:hypothetical protein